MPRCVFDSPSIHRHHRLLQAIAARSGHCSRGLERSCENCSGGIQPGKLPQMECVVPAARCESNLLTFASYEHACACLDLTGGEPPTAVVVRSPVCRPGRNRKRDCLDPGIFGQGGAPLLQRHHAINAVHCSSEFNPSVHRPTRDSSLSHI